MIAVIDEQREQLGALCRRHCVLVIQEHLHLFAKRYQVVFDHVPNELRL